MIYGVQAPKKDDPATEIYAWSIKEVDWGGHREITQHLVGYVAKNKRGRVTSAIKTFDQEKQVITTASGRIYQLTGWSGWNPDAEYVWRQWAAFNQAPCECDVTHRYYQSDV